jgi:LruC domain-containing protein
MKRFVIYTGMLAFVGLVIVLSGCKRDFQEDTPDTSLKFEDLVVDADFKFDNSRKVLANFTVVPAETEELAHIIKVYQDDPATGGKLLSKGMTDGDFKLSVSLNIPERVEKLFVENRNAQGYFEVVELFIDDGNINHTFNTLDLLNKSYDLEKTTIVDPGCGSDCDETISGTYTTLVLNKKDYCVAPGTNLTVTGQLEFKKGATLVICGTATIKSFVSADNSKSSVYISGNGVVTTSGDVNINGKLHLYNFGVYNISGNVNNKKPYNFYNEGVMNISGGLNNNTNHLINKGTLNISGNVNINSNSKFYNYATTNISAHLNVNSNSHLYNYCYLKVNGNFINNHEVRNYSYIEVGNTFTTNSNAKIFMYDGALLHTKNLMLNGNLKAHGNGYSKVDITDVTTLNSGSKVELKMDICDANGIETNNGSISNQTVFCETTIPETSCNPGSGGSTGETDTDGDGVPDVDDDYPDDPERAFNNYYPNQFDFGTLAYEDLWPGLGDYDFNDLVLNFHYKIVTNASNLIVDIIARTQVKAAGASFNNGFGIAFPVEPNRCASVTGYQNALGNINLNAIGYENGHTDNTVVIFYDAINTIYNSSIFNTVPGGNVVDTDTITVTTYFNNPQIALGQEPYNPFIYVNQERGKEIHLIDKAPTALAIMTYFGTQHDNSIPASSRWYVTENNLPWAIEIPVSFDYPIEKADVLDAYLKFSDWATSSGAVYSDWYLDEPGYRNAANIYEAE